MENRHDDPCPREPHRLARVQIVDAPREAAQQHIALKVLEFRVRWGLVEPEEPLRGWHALTLQRPRIAQRFNRWFDQVADFPVPEIRRAVLESYRRMLE